jgi:hypothetical protein
MDGKIKGMEEVLAESLAALEQGEGLDAVLARYPGEASELRPLLEMAAWMGSARGAVEPRAGFVKASRARILERIAEPQLSVWQRLVAWWSGLFRGGRRYALQLAVVVIMLACLVLGSSGIAYASQGTLPGDALYPVKLGVEQVQLWVNLDAADEVRLHMQFSQRRVEEIEALVSLGRYQNVHETMLDYEYHIDQATQQVSRLALQDPEAAGELALEMGKMLADNSVLLNALIAAVPSEVAPDFVKAISVTIVGDRALQVVIIQSGITPTFTPTPTLPVNGHPTETRTAAPSATLTPRPSETPAPSSTQTPLATPSQTVRVITVTPTATLRISSPTPTTVPVIIQPTVVQPEPSATPEPTKKPLPNPTRRPPKPDDNSGKKNTKK